MKALYDGMAQGRSYEHGGYHNSSSKTPPTPAQIKAMKERARKAMLEDARRRNAEKDFDESLFNAAMGGRMYEHGGTHPTEDEKKRRESGSERMARNAAADEAFKDFDMNAKGEPLTEAQADIVFAQWPEDAKKLGISMFDAGLLSRRVISGVKLGGKPLHLGSFTDKVLKNGDASQGYSVENLVGDYRKLFKKDGSFQLKDYKKGNIIQDAANDFMAKGFNIPGRTLKKVNSNSFTIGTAPIDYFGPRPVEEEEEIPEEVIQEEPPEDLIPADTIKPEVPPAEIPRKIREEIPVEEEEEEEEEEIPEEVPQRADFGPMINLGAGSGPSDRTGSNSADFGPTQDEQNIYGGGRTLNEPAFKVIKKPTNEKGGKLYAQGGKQISPALIAYLKKHQQKFAMGGSYRVKKKRPSMRGGGQFRL